MKGIFTSKLKFILSVEFAAFSDKQTRESSAYKTQYKAENENSSNNTKLFYFNIKGKFK